MKNIYHKIISSALIAACAVLLTCIDDPDDHPGMVWIPPGDFWMGSSNILSDPNYDLNSQTNERTSAGLSHKVTLTKGFWMSRYQITQEQFFLIMGQEPAVPAYGEHRPAEGLSWYEAVEFCNKLSEKEGLTPYYTIDKTVGSDLNNNSFLDPLKWLVTRNTSANGYRLPTEAEWEYACRAGTTKAYNFFDEATGKWGTDVPPTKEQANFGKAPDWSEGSTCYVGRFAPNAWGLYDMHGNVSELCWDWYNGNYYSDPDASEDPTGQSSGTGRIMRGGGWNSSVGNVRSAYRNNNSPNLKNANIGVRVVRQ